MKISNLLFSNNSNKIKILCQIAFNNKEVQSHQIKIIIKYFNNRNNNNKNPLNLQNKTSVILEDLAL